MERDELKAAAQRAGLERLFELFPDEVAAALALVADQRQALHPNGPKPEEAQ